MNLMFKQQFGHSPHKKPLKEAKTKKHTKVKTETASRKSSRIAAKELPPGIYKDDNSPGLVERKQMSSTTSVKVQSRLEQTAEPSVGNFPCSDCNKVFQYKNNLTKHVRAVHKETVFYCEVCFSGFSYLTNLKRHSEKEHNKSTSSHHNCKECRQTFTYKHNLKTHYLKFHKREM